MKKLIFLGITVLSLLGAAIFSNARSTAHPVAIFQEDIYVHLPLVMKNFVSGPGGIEGVIFNASSQERQPISEADVCIESLQKCIRTGAGGEYAFTNLAPGDYILTIEHESFYTREVDVIIADLKNTRFDIGLVGRLALGDIAMRITVEWANQPYWYGSGCPSYQEGCPSDLDAHIWGVFTGVSQHFFQDDRGDCSSGAAICLEAIAVNGPGPETVAIRKIQDVNSRFYYGVHNYYSSRSGVPDIYHTGAVVQVFQENGDYYEVPVTQASGVGNFWYVFSMNAQGVITFHNCVITKPQGDELPQCPE